MLTLLVGQPESLWDEALPVEVRQLPFVEQAVTAAANPRQIAPDEAAVEQDYKQVRGQFKTEKEWARLPEDDGTALSELRFRSRPLLIAIEFGEGNRLKRLLVEAIEKRRTG